MSRAPAIILAHPCTNSFDDAPRERSSILKVAKSSRLSGFATSLMAAILIVLLAAPQYFVHARSFQNPNGEGDVHRDDPCDQLPNSPGKALGIDKKCPAVGSSSGVA